MTFDATDLHCARPGLTLFEPVSFALPAGQALILRGPNGIGKTTLLRALAGLGPPAKGQVRLNGTPLDAQDGSVAYTGHLDAIKPSLTVGENLQFWASIYGAQSIDEALRLFDLAGLENRAAGRMSAGQKRRLGLARLAVMSAPLWLLDEPTVSLDTESTGRLADMIKRHLSAGGFALVATHVNIPLPAKTLTLAPAKAERNRPDADPFLAAGFS